MNLKYILTISAISLLEFVKSELTINSPVQWKAGDTVKSTWSYAPDSSLTVSSFNLDLVTGDSSNLQVVQNLGQNIDPTLGSVSVVVPPSVASGSNYALKATATTPSGPAFRFTGRFAVSNDGKATSSPPSSPSSPPSSSPPPPAKDNAKVGNTTENNSTGNANGSAYNYQSPVLIFGTSVLASIFFTLA